MEATQGSDPFLKLRGIHAFSPSLNRQHKT